MANEFIKCPECGAEFQISQAISHDIEVTVAKKYLKVLSFIDLLCKSNQERLKLTLSHRLVRISKFCYNNS